MIFKLLPDSNTSHDLAFVNDVDHAWFARFDGSTLGGSWKPVPVTAADEDDELAQFGDYALLGTIPVFSGAAVAALRPILERNGELLPLSYPRREFYAYNLTRFVDALDESLSTLTRLDSGRIMSVERFVFHSARLKDESVFKLPQLPRAFVFATNAFVDAVRDAELAGFAFRAL